MVSDKMIYRAFRTNVTLYKQNLLEKLLIFSIYQNYQLALINGYPLFSMKDICLKFEVNTFYEILCLYLCKFHTG